MLDKWFAVQARAAPRQFGRDRARLLSHPKFSLKNPNRVRALIGSFVHANPTGFNRADGAGFAAAWPSRRSRSTRFNPHVAARLLGAFESWRILEPVRQARARAVLEGLAARKLSTDSYEIVTKTLGASRSGNPLLAAVNRSLTDFPQFSPRQTKSSSIPMIEGDSEMRQLLRLEARRTLEGGPNVAGAFRA